MEAGKKQIADILNGARILEIPFFQRSYVWGKEQWERFLADMEDISWGKKPYFMGSVILKQMDTAANSAIGDRRLLIDGQQRLTTLVIFFKVLCLKCEKQDVFNRRFTLDNGTVALEHNHNDRAAFEKIASLQKLKAFPEDTGKKVIDCYNFFKECVNVDKLRIDNILSNILFICIDLSRDEDEQQIFDTINSLGVRLTTAELLKNFFFNKENISLYEAHWKVVFEPDEEDGSTKDYWDTEISAGGRKRALIDLFLDAYLQIKAGNQELKVSSEDRWAFGKTEHLFQSYKKIVTDYCRDNKNAIVKEIAEYARIFKNHFDTKSTESELPAKPSIERITAIIFGLNSTTLLPYVLFVLKNQCNEAEREGLFAVLESYIMRRIVASGCDNRGYNRLFSDRLINGKILTRDAFIKAIAKSDDGALAMPSDKALRDGFKNHPLINQQSTGVLYLIEASIRDRAKQGTKLLGLSKYSLEHLMPKKWRNKWWGKAADDAARDKKLLTLGNLTIITQTLNASIRDSDWPTKKSGKKNNGLLAYAQGIEILRVYLDLEKWDEAAIEKRAEDLYQKAVKIWPRR